MTLNTMAMSTTEALTSVFSEPTTTPMPATLWPQREVPNLPKWLIGLALSWLAFGSVFAVILIMAQFPTIFPWWAEISAQPPPPRGRKRSAGREGRSRGMSSAVAHAGGDGGGFRMRKPKNLSVDMQAQRTGASLGIVMPNGDNKVQGKSVKKRISFDPTSTRAEAPDQSRQAATAPLPQRKTMTLLQAGEAETDDDDSDDEILRCPDIETGHPMRNTRDLDDHYADPRASPYFNNEHSGAAEDDDEQVEKGGGWMNKINRGVYKVADRLSATFYDQVNGVEDGLLLPVKENERDVWMGRALD